MENSDVIAALNKLDLSSSPYKEVRHMVEQFSFKHLRITIPAGTLIERIRPDVNVYERKDVTYRPADQNDKPQRATLPSKTAFYGTICHTKDALANMRVITLLESSKLCNSDMQAAGVEQFTLSRWRTNSDLHLIVFAHESVYPAVNNNKMLVEAKAVMKKAMLLDSVMQDDGYEQYVTEQFAKSVADDCNYEYIISATIADHLMYTMQVDGIMYPSVASGGQYGMNVALRDDIADSRLILEDVNEMEYVQQKGEGRFRFLRKAKPISSDEHGYNTWRYVPYGVEDSNA